MDIVSHFANADNTKKGSSTTRLPSPAAQKTRDFNVPIQDAWLHGCCFVESTKSCIRFALTVRPQNTGSQQDPTLPCAFPCFPGLRIERAVCHLATPSTIQIITMPRVLSKLLAPRMQDICVPQSHKHTDAPIQNYSCQCRS